MAHVACLRAGLVVVPANTGYRSEELGHILADSAPAAAIIDDDERAAWCRAGRLVRHGRDRARRFPCPRARFRPSTARSSPARPPP